MAEIYEPSMIFLAFTFMTIMVALGMMFTACIVAFLLHEMIIMVARPLATIG